MKLEIPKTIQIVAPLWTDKIKKSGSIVELEEITYADEHILDISHVSRCIVGESLNLLDTSYDYAGYVKFYGCDHCAQHSTSFYDIIEKGTRKEFKDELERFADHLESHHKKILRSRK